MTETTRYTVQNFVDGAERSAFSGQTRPLVAPATAEPLGTAAWSSAADVTAAVDRAATAARPWAALGRRPAGTRSSGGARPLLRSPRTSRSPTR